MTIGHVKEQHVKPYRETGVLDRDSELNMTAHTHTHTKEMLNENRPG